MEYVHSKGMKFELHSCGYVTPLVGDFVELGMDILQPVQTNNDLKAMKEQWGDKIVYRLAIFDKQFDRLGQSEDQVRADIRSYYEILAPGGNFILIWYPLTTATMRSRARSSRNLRRSSSTSGKVPQSGKERL